RHHHQDLGVLGFVVGGREQVPEQRNLTQPRQPAHVVGDGVDHHAAQHRALAVAQFDGVVNNAVAEHRLLDAADVVEAIHFGDLDAVLQQHRAVGVDLRRHINVDADRLIGELGVHQRVDAHASDAGLEAPGCGGYFL